MPAAPESDPRSLAVVARSKSTPRLADSELKASPARAFRIRKAPIAPDDQAPFDHPRHRGHRSETITSCAASSRYSSQAALGRRHKCHHYPRESDRVPSRHFGDRFRGSFGCRRRPTPPLLPPSAARRSMRREGRDESVAPGGAVTRSHPCFRVLRHGAGPRRISRTHQRAGSDRHVAAHPNATASRNNSPKSYDARRSSLLQQIPGK